MKTREPKEVTSKEPSEDEIRDYAAHLYEQSGRIPGRDLDNWLEAKACLQANIPKEHAHRRLHWHRHPEEFRMVEIATIEVEPESTFRPWGNSERSVQVAEMVVLKAPASRAARAVPS